MIWLELRAEARLGRPRRYLLLLRVGYIRSNAGARGLRGGANRGGGT